MFKSKYEFPSSKRRREVHDHLKAKKKDWDWCVVGAFFKSLFFKGLQRTGQSFTTSDEPNQIQLQDSVEQPLDVVLRPSVKVYPCGHSSNPNLYLVRDTVTEDHAIIDAKLAHLLFNL